MEHRRLILIVLLLLGILAAPAHPADDDPTPLQLERAIFRSFDAADYERAASLIEEYLRQRPGDAQMLYNLACARSRLGELEQATSALYRAVQSGFRDFSHMKSDPDLEAIRDREMYRAILDAAERVAGDAAEQSLEFWKRTFGTEGYRFEIDGKHRLAFATALDEVAHGEMREMLLVQADHLIDTLFGAPPDYYVLIAVPTPRDANTVFNGEESVGGRYEHGNRRLIARDIGGSLRHEFVHAMHYGHMERLGLTEPHPIWIQEGLAALYEDYEIADDGTLIFRANERNNIVKNLARVGRLKKWDTLFSMSAERFMTQPGQYYPQVRAIFEFLSEQGKLSAWYRAYVAAFADDRSGAHAFEEVFKKPVAEIEAEWRTWVKRRPTVDNRIEQGDAALGINCEVNASNDGVKIAELLPGSSARRSRLRVGDVIVSVDGRPTRSIQELQTLIGERNVGERITVRIRRNGRYQAVEVVLRPLSAPGR